MNTRILLSGVITAAMLSITSCLSDGGDSILLEGEKSQFFGKTDIPDDSQATKAPDVYENTTNIPNCIFTPVDEDGDFTMKIDMTGLLDHDTNEWLKLFGTGEPRQNVWVDVDGEPKGVRVYNSDDDGITRRAPVDLIFLVDNSGSMDDEADAIARDILSWSEKLEKSGIDIRFACVGYDSQVNGAHDFCSQQELSAYLNRSYGTGRTYGFGGDNAGSLSSMATNYYYTSGECGMAALRFADANLAFRNASTRIYVNFTDEPNQPYGKEAFSVEALRNASWSPEKGTIHSVLSDTSLKTMSFNSSKEDPKLMSDYTGGTTIYTNSSFTGVTLEDLPVTGAMLNSYVLRIANVEKYVDGRSHGVRITVKDEKNQASKTFYIMFTRPGE